MEKNGIEVKLIVNGEGALIYAYIDISKPEEKTGRTLYLSKTEYELLAEEFKSKK